MKEIKIGTRYLWIEDGYIIRGIIKDIKEKNIIIHWYGKTNYSYKMDYFMNETRIQMDKEYYRDQKLKDLLGI